MSRMIKYAVFLGYMVSSMVMAAPANTDVGVNFSQPEQLVQATTNTMLAILAQQQDAIKKNPNQIYALMEKHLLPHFDFKGMSRFVIGKYWRRATAQQQERFTGAFRDLLVRTYAGALLAYQGETVNFITPRKGDIKAKKALVRSSIVHQGQDVSVNYRLWRKKEVWKVYDLVIEGVSLLSNFRTQLTQEVSQFGIDNTIEKMQRNQDELVVQTPVVELRDE